MPTEKPGIPAGIITNQIPVVSGSNGVSVKVEKLKSALNSNTPSAESGHSPREGDKKTGLFSSSTWKLVEITIAEVIGTACLMYFGCMGDLLPPIAGAAVFGLVVCTLIQIFGHISEAHFNPVVTLIAIVLGKETPFTALFYFAAETVGAIMGMILLKVSTPCDLWDAMGGNTTGVCTTIPISSLTDSESLALEFAATTFLSLTVCGVWDPRNADKSDSTPLKVGATITVISMTVGPLTGASMNPVRSLAPALVNGVWTSHWIYWIGPMSAGFLTSVFYQIVFSKKQSLESKFVENPPLTGVTVCNGNIIQNIRQSNCTLNEKPSNTSLKQYPMKT